MRWFKELFFGGFFGSALMLIPALILGIFGWVQGSILGFGVSGTEQAGLFIPVFGDAPTWLTDNQFGLEASLPGLICVGIMLFVLYTRKSTA